MKLREPAKVNVDYDEYLKFVSGVTSEASSDKDAFIERVNELKERWETLKMEKTVPSAIYKTKVMDKQILSIGKAWHGSAPISSFAKSNRRIAYLAFITNDKMNSLKCFDGEQSRVGHS